ncbi:MAG: DUF4255 domain-containing protein [Deltaproteobacteria bacterium]|nr:DUF4255 domain-containing protein [Deltaproteobacteria bacterium]
MSQFEVIRDLGETVKELLKESFKTSGFTTVSVGTEKPKKDNIKNLPTVNCFLYHIGFAQNYRERTDGLVSTHDREGNIVEFYRDGPVYLNANFAISVWGNSPAEENLLLGLVVKTFLENTVLAGPQLKGDSFYPDDQINIHPNLQADANDTMSFWRSMNEELRPTLFYFIRFRVESDRRSTEVRRVIGRDFAVRR